MTTAWNSKMLAPALLACAMMVHPVTLNAVVGVESGFNPVAIHINGIDDKDQPHPKDAAEAAAIAHRAIASGRNVDLGLAQVNSRNLAGRTVEQVLDPCTNLHVGGTILAAFYAKAVRALGEGQDALKAALSTYHSGNYWTGFADGYVAKYYTVPSINMLNPITRIVPIAINRHASDTEIWE
jgi:type IV secretion system protein VirB1